MYRTRPVGGCLSIEFISCRKRVVGRAKARLSIKYLSYDTIEKNYQRIQETEILKKTYMMIEHKNSATLPFSILNYIIQKYLFK